jgi:hypothetical protein
MTTITISDDVRSYAEQVGVHLQDLTEDERCDLLDDLEQHLAEIEAENEGTLEERLGAPQDYAAELRASAGLSPATLPPPGEGLVQRWVRSAPARAWRSFAASAPARSVRAFLPELRPGWWVARGALFVMALATLLDASRRHAFGSLVEYSIPGLALGFTAAAAAVAASVALGRKARGSRLHVFSFIVNAAVVVMVAVAMGQQVIPVSYEEVAYGDFSLQHSDGSQITNICPYGADGKLLEGTLLFDQDGRPIVNVAQAYPGEFAVKVLPGERYVRVEPPVQPSVPLFTNAYPKQQTFADPYTGEARPFSCPKVQVPGHK